MRVRGRPRSANAASSFHLLWAVPTGEPLVEAEVALLVEAAPVAERLYFWALQVSFEGGGGAHLGLQWAADPPRRWRHLNWGGYDAGGAELAGTASSLTSSFGNANTRDFDWSDGEWHRLRISHDEAGWCGWVDDVLVRRLRAPGPFLHSPMVWSEVFADCDHPSVTVRWSSAAVVTQSGARLPIRSARTHYQSRADGGCDNTSSAVEGAEFVQTTATRRATPPGVVLSLEPGP